MRFLRAIARVLRRHRGRWRKKFITGRPRSLFIARSRQRAAEKYFSREFSRGVSGTYDRNRPEPTVSLAFVHVPKCGGTSLHFWLRDELGLVKLNSVQLFSTALRSRRFPPFVSLGHMNPDAVIERGLLQASALNQSFSFSLVRNPFTRALSLFSHFQNIGQLSEAWTLNKFLRLVQKSQPEPGFYNLARLSQAAPQVSWVRQRKWAGPSSIIHLENPEALESELRRRFGVASSLFTIRNSNSSRFLGEWDTKSTSLVQDIYAEDFEALGYSPDLLPWEVE